MSYGHRTFLAGWHFLSPSYFCALSLSHSLFTSCQTVPGAAIIPHPSSIPFFSIQEWACWGSAALNFTSCVGIFFLYLSGGFRCFVCGWFWVSLVAVCFLASISPVCEAGGYNASHGGGCEAALEVFHSHSWALAVLCWPCVLPACWKGKAKPFNWNLQEVTSPKFVKPWWLLVAVSLAFRKCSSVWESVLWGLLVLI